MQLLSRSRSSFLPPSAPACRLLWTSALFAAVASSCSNSDDSESFVVKTSAYSYQPGSILTVAGGYAIALADEDGAPVPVDLNGDLDTGDEVAVAVNLGNGAETLIGAAAREAFVLGAHLYFIVEEAGNNDWNGNMLDETVLLRWTAGELEPSFLTGLLPGSSGIVSQNRLWVISSQTPAATDETALRFIDAATPTQVQTVFAEPGTTGSVTPRVLDEEQGLLMVGLDESVNGDQNGDLDANDARVIAFVEAGAVNPTLQSSSLAAPESGFYHALRLRSAAVWDIALLVSEAAQNQNLNGVLTPPVQCSSGTDSDQDDQVLHVARFESGVLSSFTNTELPGTTNPDANRIVLTEDVVALNSQESHYGPAPGCDLNGDGDFDDLIVRWTPLDDPDNAQTSLNLMRAVDVSLPGGARGLVELSGRLIVGNRQEVPTPAGDQTVTVLGWVDPIGGVAFEQDFFDPEDSNFSDPIVTAVDWMSSEQILGRNPIAILEGPTMLNLNLGCTGVAKDSGSADTEDSIASWLLFSATNNEMILAGRGWAVQPGNSGLTIAAGHSFFRVSEDSDGFNWNGDGDSSDQLLFRVPLTQCDSTNMGVLNSIPGEPAIHTDGVFGAAYFADETAQGLDLNMNGEVAGLALRTFRF